MKKMKCRVASFAIVSVLLLVNLVPNIVTALDRTQDSLQFPQASTTVKDDLDFNSPFELAKHFHIFSNEVSNTVHVNGNIATKHLKETKNFGTVIKNESTHVPLDLFYIQKLDMIASSSFVKQTTQRKNKVVFGSSVNLSLVDNNTAAAIAGSKLDNLKLDEIYQDQGDNVYIDFDEVFTALREQSDQFHQASKAAGIVIDTSDQNKRTVDVSGIILDHKANQLVRLKKVDDLGNPLKGAAFDLYQGDAKNPLDTDVKLNDDVYRSDAEGLIELTLSSGQYYFKEVVAPTGYLLDQSLHGFVVEESINSNATVYVDIDASLLEANTPLYITGMTTDGPSYIFNVITDGKKTLQIESQIKLSIDGVERVNKETEYFLDAKLLWNFSNEVETININRPFQGSVLATGAHVTTDANLDGSIIADKVTIGGESHRWEFQSTTNLEPIELTVVNEVDTEIQPTETDPTESEPTETDPVETEPVETDPVETEPTETEPVETDPTETEPTETEPTETDPTETEPVETDPTESEPTETVPVETDPTESEPTETEPVETEPTETSPTETEPVETKPTETEPTESEPVKTEPVETEPTEPVPTEIESLETEPSKTEATGTTEDEAIPTSITPESGVGGEVVSESKPGGEGAEITNPPLTGDLLPSWLIDLFIVLAAAFAIGGIGFLIYEKRFDKRQ